MSDTAARVLSPAITYFYAYLYRLGLLEVK